MLPTRAWELLIGAAASIAEYNGVPRASHIKDKLVEMVAGDVRDRFDSSSRAAQIDIPVFIAAAEQDRVVLPRHTQALREQLTAAPVEYVLIQGAAHNDITGFAQYRDAIADFIATHRATGE